MGLFRLLLAILVALSHTGARFYGYNPGVVAVISFFILSGYVMSMLIAKYYNHSSTVPTFYLDRIARLFPQFLFYMVLASIFIYFVKFNSYFFNEANLTFIKWLANFFILPQGFYMLWSDNAIVIPQSWSLGLELTFYICIPWILIYFSARKIYILALISALIFLAAYFGKIDSDIFGYRLLPGTIFMFLVGWSFFKNDRGAVRFRRIVFIGALTLFLFAYTIKKTLYELPFNKEVLVGLMIGIAAVDVIRRMKFSEMDEFFGNLSYGVFLNHFLVIWVMQKFFITEFSIFNYAAFLLITLVLAFVSFFYIERPALKWRHAIRIRAMRSNPTP